MHGLSRQRSVRGRRLSRFGSLLAIGASVAQIAVIAFVVLEFMDSGRFLADVLTFVGAFSGSLLLTATAIGGSLLANRGKRLQALSAPEAMTRDPRPPIIYFRAFADEHDTGRVATRTGTSAYYRFGRTEEEYLRAEIVRAGPFVAVGKPGDKLPPLGADRLYTSDLDWQSAVDSMLAVAAGAIVRVGVGGGLSWEILRTISRLPPDRVVFLVPEGANRYHRFKAAMDPQLPRPLPNYPAPTSQGSGPFRREIRFSLAGFIYFDAHWVGRFHQFSIREVDPTDSAIAGEFRRLLTPFVARIWGPGVGACSEPGPRAARRGVAGS